MAAAAPAPSATNSTKRSRPIESSTEGPNSHRNPPLTTSGQRSAPSTTATTAAAISMTVTTGNRRAGMSSLSGITERPRYSTVEAKWKPGFGPPSSE